jgi:hypothetical protein
VQVGNVGRDGAAGIDQHHAHIGARCLGGDDALVEHGMAPAEIAADQHDEVGQFEVFVIAGNGIGAEGALMAGDGGGHAEARIGVDIARADEALHQLVGDVIVFRQQLSRAVKCNRVGAV